MNIENTKSWKLQVGTSYGVLTYSYVDTTWVLVPTDASYAMITLSTVTEDYLIMYNDAKAIIALEQGRDTAVLDDIIEQLGWTTDATEVSITYPTGTWTFTKVIEADRFGQVQSNLINYLNELTNGL